MIAQNLCLDKFYHTEASNLTFGNKRLAYAQSRDMVYITHFALCETHFTETWNAILLYHIVRALWAKQFELSHTKFDPKLDL